MTAEPVDGLGGAQLGEAENAALAENPMLSEFDRPDRPDTA
jgi:hypothetical protein